MARVRQVRLKPECADHHPTLPARMWTSAAVLAALVRSGHPAVPQLAGKVIQERTLSETDFDFRGGNTRGLAGLFARTRIGELAFSPPSATNRQPLSGPPA